jgi:hypothetical protein
MVWRWLYVNGRWWGTWYHVLGTAYLLTVAGCEWVWPGWATQCGLLPPTIGRFVHGQ